MTKKRKRGLPAMHPGELLREDVLPALGQPKSEIARLPARYDLERAEREVDVTIIPALRGLKRALRVTARPCAAR